MTQDQRLLALLHRQANPIETLRALASLTLSKQARQTYRQYGATTKMLRACLTDDDVLVIKTPHAHQAKWLLLAALVVVITIEFSNYTIPAIHEWLITVAHRCGL